MADIVSYPFNVTLALTVTDNPEQYLSHQLDRTRLVVSKILFTMVVVFGIIGNGMNIAVLTRAWMRSSTNFYLTALAVCDVMYLIIAYTLSLSLYPAIIRTEGYVNYFPVGKPLADIFSNTGVWMTLTFTVERYIAVCYPMKGKAWCTPERARYVIAAVSVSAAVITFPEFFEFRATSQINERNVTKYSFEVTEFASQPSYAMGYSYTNQALFTILPLILLVIFNSLLIRTVMQAAKERRRMAAAAQSSRHDRHHHDQQRITIMLICVVMVFLLCQLPQAISNLYGQYSSAMGHESRAARLKRLTLNNIFNLLVMVNSSVNFLLYSAFSTKFRRTFNRLFCRCSRSSRRVPPELLFSEIGTPNPPADGSQTHLLHASRGSRVSCTWQSNDKLKNSTPEKQPQQHLQPNYQEQPRPSPPRLPRNGYLGVRGSDDRPVVSSV